MNQPFFGPGRKTRSRRKPSCPTCASTWTYLKNPTHGGDHFLCSKHEAELIAQEQQAVDDAKAEDAEFKSGEYLNYLPKQDKGYTIDVDNIDESIRKIAELLTEDPDVLLS